MNRILAKTSRTLRDPRHGRRVARPSARSVEFLESRLLLTTYQVDDDGVQCPDADFFGPTGIQDALTAAAASPEEDHIHVCPGVYFPVVVTPGNAGDVLEGEGEGADISVPQSAEQCGDQPLDVASDPTEDSIITGVPPTGFIGGVNILANDFTIEGFVIEDNIFGPGIYTAPTTSGVVIQDNLIQNNVFGIYLNSSGADEQIVEHNWINNNTQPGAASGNGIYSDQGLRNAVVNNNLFSNHTNAGIITIGFGPTATALLEVTHNAFCHDASMTFLQLLDSNISYNVSVESHGSGVVLTDARNVSVDHNEIVDPTFNGISLTTVGVGESANVRIQYNRISGAGDNGIRLSFSTNNLVAHNLVELSANDGIVLETTSDNNLILDNQSDNNGSDGIHVFLGSVQNRIIHNLMDDNGEHDAHDDNPAATTVNTWRRNICETENQPGLCEHPH